MPVARAGAAPHTPFGRALKILGTFAESAEAGLTLTGIAHRPGVPMTTVHRLVGRLEHERLLERDDEVCYRVGLMLWELGLIPLLLLFIAAGRQLVGGIMEGAVKG